MKIGRIIAIAVLLCLLLPVTIGVLGDIEPNNTFEQAEVIGEGTYSGTVYDSWTSGEDVDYYQITIPENNTAEFLLTSGYNSSIRITLYTDERIKKDTASCSDGEATKLIEDTGSAAVTLYVKIECGTWASGENNYTLKVTFSGSTSENPSEDLTDPFEQAEVIGEGVYSGVVSYSIWGTSNDVDYYQINIPEHKRVDVRVISGQDSEIEVSLYDSKRVLRGAGICSDGSATIVSEDPAGDSETVYLKIYTSNYEPTYNKYTLEVNYSDSSWEAVEQGATIGSMLCIGGFILILVLIVVVIVVLLRKKGSNPLPMMPYTPPPVHPQEEVPEEEGPDIPKIPVKKLKKKPKRPIKLQRCPSCNELIPEDVAFCQHCGSELD